MSNISNKQKVTAIAAIGAAAVFGMLSFGNSAQAANRCHLWNAALGVSCCDLMTGSRLIDTNSDCHGQKKKVLKRKPNRRLPPITHLLDKEWVEGSKGNGGDNGGGNKGKGPNGRH
jgi:hypothetical protein